jgi:hypothetical protein
MQIYRLKFHHRGTENTEKFLCDLCVSVVSLQVFRLI